MKEKKQNPVSEEKSPSDDKKSVEDKEKIEQNENLCEEEENNASTNKDFQATLNEEKEVKIPSKSTKVNDIKQKEEKDGEKDNSNIFTKKIIFVVTKVTKEFKSTKKQRKIQKAPIFYIKKEYRKPRGKKKIFVIKKVQKVKYENKKNISFKSPLKAKKENNIYILLFLARKSYSFYSNWTPPPYKGKIFYIRESPQHSSSTKDRVTSRNDDDEKLTKEDFDVIRNVCNNHDKNNYIYQNGLNYDSESYNSLPITSTNYKSN